MLILNLLALEMSNLNKNQEVIYEHVCGRIREQINKSGEKINPSDLEEVIKLHENIDNNSAIAIPDKNVINKICACIVTDKKDMKIVELREFVEGHGLTTYKLPDYILLVDSIPLTAVGKTDKKKLLEIFNMHYAACSGVEVQRMLQKKHTKQREFAPVVFACNMHI